MHPTKISLPRYPWFSLCHVLFMPSAYMHCKRKAQLFPSFCAGTPPLSFLYHSPTNVYIFLLCRMLVDCWMLVTPDLNGFWQRPTEWDMTKKGVTNVYECIRRLKNQINLCFHLDLSCWLNQSQILSIPSQIFENYLHFWVLQTSRRFSLCLSCWTLYFG